MAIYIYPVTFTKQLCKSCEFSHLLFNITAASQYYKGHICVWGIVSTCCFRKCADIDMTSCENDKQNSQQTLEYLRIAHMFSPAKNDVGPTSARPPHLVLSQNDACVLL